LPWERSDSQSACDGVRPGKTRGDGGTASRNLQGGPKSKPLSLIIIKSYQNPPLWLDFKKKFDYKMSIKYYNKSALNIYVT